MISSNLSSTAEALLARQPFRLLKGLASKYIVYPFSEARENRLVSPKVSALRKYYQLATKERLFITAKHLTECLSFAKVHVPYYRDLFESLNFDPTKALEDISYLNDIPFLAKDIIREQGNRLLSKPMQGLRHYVCKTDDSTGKSCTIYYDQVAADYSAAITLYAR